MTEAQQKEVVDIVADLNSAGKSNVYMERALGLSFGTIKLWCSGRFDEVDLALLRIIRCYPAMVEIADNNFKCEIREITFGGESPAQQVNEE